MHLRRVLLVLSIAAALASVDVGGAQTPVSASLFDLPAAALTPADAEALGFEGFGRFGNGHQRHLDEYAQQRASFQNKPVSDVVATLNDAGWLQGYSAELLVPDLPGSQDAQPLEVLFSSSYQYASPEGASAALAYVTDYSGVTAADVDTEVDGPLIGDESVWSRTTSATLDQQGPSDEVAVVFRVGNLLAAVGDIDYTVTADDVATPTAVDPARVERVAALAERVTEHLNGLAGAPGLSLLVNRLGSEESTPTLTDEGYRRLDGLDIPYFNEFTDDFPGSADATTSAYEYTAALDQVGGDPYDPYFVARVLQFPDESTASEYLARAQADLGTPGTPGAGSTIGDESVLIPESFQPLPGMTVNGWISLARVGDRVAQILFESADHTPDPAIVLALTGAQVHCLETGECPLQPIPTDW